MSSRSVHRNPPKANRRKTNGEKKRKLWPRSDFAQIPSLSLCNERLLPFMCGFVQTCENLVVKKITLDLLGRRTHSAQNNKETDKTFLFTHFKPSVAKKKTHQCYFFRSDEFVCRRLWAPKPSPKSSFLRLDNWFPLFSWSLLGNWRTWRTWNNNNKLYVLNALFLRSLIIIKVNTVNKWRKTDIFIRVCWREGITFRPLGKHTHKSLSFFLTFSLPG